MKKLFILPALSLASQLVAQDNAAGVCGYPQPPAPCYSADTSPKCDYCLGPENIAGNPAVYPYSCNGDVVLTIAGFYWNANQDGLEYALEDLVAIPPPGTFDNTNRISSIIEGEFLKPRPQWDWGFKLGLGYNSSHDGWDVQVLWTHFKNRASSCVESDDNATLLPLWSGFATNAVSFGTGAGSNPLYATDMSSTWSLKLDLVDLEFGRAFWNSKYVTLRPHMGLRLASLGQSYEINYSGGAWQGVLNGVGEVIVPATISQVALDGKFDGVGVRAGLDTDWYVGHGFSLFGNAAISIVYGRFSIEQDEHRRATQSPFSKFPVLTTEENFHSSKAMTDLELGFEWTTMFNECRYGFTIAAAWEQHMFFNQNQFWRVTRVDGQPVADNPNPTGENVFIQRRGDLSTHGWTVTATFDF